MKLALTIPMSQDLSPADASTAPVAFPAATDHKAFSILVRQHHRQFLAYARALVPDCATAADITQEALITAYHNLLKFDATADFPAWVRGIIKNKWREQARKKAFTPLSEEVLTGLDSQHAAWSYAQQTAQDQNPLFVKLEGCLEKLPESLRTAVDETYFRQKTSEEAATDQGTSAAALRKRLERARHALRQCMEVTPQLATA